MFRPLNYTYNVLVSALINLINSFFLSLYLLEKMNDFYVVILLSDTQTGNAMNVA